MVKYSELKAGMTVSVEKVDRQRWENNLGDLIINPALTPEIWYNKYYKNFVGVPIKIIQKKMTNRPLHTGNPTPYQMLIVKNPKGQDGYLPEFLFNPRDNDAFKDLTLDRGRDVRNTRLMAARMGLPHGPESIIASQLSGLPGNAAQQNDQLAKEDGKVSGPAPDRRGFSGGKTRKGHNSKKTRRTRKH